MFLDIAGFTKITEAASKKGRYGVELVTDIINLHFSRSNAIVCAAGGEIFKYGGDSCLIIFPWLKPDEFAILQAVAGDIAKHCAKLDRLFHRKYGVRFALHGGCCMGSVGVNIVGDPAHHLDYYVDGEAISRAYELAEGAQSINLDESRAVPASAIPQPPDGTDGRSRFNFLPPAVKAKLASGNLAAELRNATVVFINLGSSQGEHIPLQDYDNWFRQVQHFVYRYDGVVNKIDYTDKGYLILLVFGVPIVHQDDIERAFICATRITQIRSEHLKIRIGINYSNIYVGKIGSPRRWEYGIIGNAVNIAARLMGFGETGQICISQEIISKVSHKFELAFIASAPVKGISKKIEIYKLVRELPEQWTQYQNLFGSKHLCLPIEKLQALQGALDGKDEALITIGGAAGSGKSYLIWYLGEHLLATGKSFHLLSADEFTMSIRLEFFYRSLRNLLGIQNFGLQFEELISWCRAHELVFDPDILHHSLLSGAHAQGSNELVQSILSDILSKLYPPTECLIIDPIDNFDAQSRDLIIAIAKRNLAAGGKVIVSSSSSQDWLQNSYFQHANLDLENLSPEESSRLVNHYLPLASPAAAAELIRLTGSNPRFLCELLEHIRSHYYGESDLITETDIANMQTSGLIPDRIENLMLFQYQEMQAPMQQTIKIACIFGRPFLGSELSRIYSGSEQTGFLQNLEEACKLGILTIIDLVPEAVYSFANPLLRESIYRTILRNDKVKLHNDIAEFYKARLASGETELLETVAYHYIQTGKRPQVLHWAAILAEDYFAKGALELSKNYYNILIDNALNREQRISAQLKVLEIMLSLAANEAAGNGLDELAELMDEQGILHDRYTWLKSRYYNNIADFPQLKDFLQNRLPQVSDAGIRELLRIDYCEALMLQGDTQAFTEEAIGLFDELSLRKDLANQNRLSGIIAQFYNNQGEYGRALKYYRLKQQLSVKLHDPVGIRIGYSGMGIALSRSGKKDEALGYFQEALRTAEQSGDRNGYSKALLNIGTILRNQGNYEEALQHYQKSLVIAQHIGNLMQESIIIYDIGELLSYQDRHEEAVTYFRKSLAVAEKIHDDSGKSFCYDAIGDNYFHRSFYTEAKATYEENLILQLRINDQEGIAHTYGNLGNIAKTEQDWDLARANYRKQLEILDKVGDQDGSGRAWFNLGMIDIEAGVAPEAKTKLERALELFKSCGAQYYIDITQEQLDKI